MRHLKLAATGLLVACMGALATAEVESGLKPGDSVGAFNVKDVTGPRKGSSLCYRCALGGRTVVNIQARKISDDLVSMVKELDSMVDSVENLDGSDTKHAFVVYLTDDPDAAAKELEAVAKKHDIKNIPLTVFDGITGPRNYKIAKDAEVTVLMWEGHEVKNNHAFAANQLDKQAVKKVLGDAKQLLN